MSNVVDRRRFLRGVGLLAATASVLPPGWAKASEHLIDAGHGGGLVQPRPRALLLADDFSALDPKRWVAEIETPQRSRWYVQDGRMWLDSQAGMTVWLRRPLSGRYRIQYTRQVFAAGTGGSDNARLSDLNQFWAARDPRYPDVFTRHGALAEYDALDLHYVGVGGNGNTTTRFRHYDGEGHRLLLGEYLDPAHLLRPEHRYQIRIDVTPESTAFWVDGARWFERHAPIPAGYFGFRTTWSLQAISDLCIHAL